MQAWYQFGKSVEKWLPLSIKITIRAQFALIILKGFFFCKVSLGSVDVNNTYMRIRKMILILLYKICCINMQIFLLVNHSKGHTIVITKMTIV